MRGKRMTIFIGESDQWHHRSLYLAILEELRSAGCAGATVTRGVAGFGAHSQIKTANVLRLSIDLPVVITVIDTAERVDRLLPRLAAMLSAGVVTVDETEVYFSSAAFKGGLPDVQVGDVMRAEVDSVTVETSIADVVERLVAHDYTALPVIDAGRRVVGVVADSDLLRSGATHLSVSLHKATSGEAIADSLARLRARGGVVHDCMTAPAVTVTPRMPLRDAALRMRERGLKRFPVVDDGGRLVGVLGRLDILNSITTAHAHRTVPREHRLPQEHRTVAEIMEKDVPTVVETTPIHDVISRLMESDAKRILVLDEAGRLAGIITDTDIVARIDPAVRPGLLTLLRSRWSTVADRQVRRASGQRAADIMTSPVVTVPASALVIEARTLTVARHVKRLPVTDADGRIIGMVARPALLAASLDIGVKEEGT
ncbi:MAG: DUF190 domain-containing protein [Deltaproteobacteria bacterium]|nr:DUF190 domain-containing protein [Deltaproteobacteria bacterium]